MVHIVVNFFSIPQSRLGDMASLPVPNCLSLVLYNFSMSVQNMTILAVAKEIVVLATNYAKCFEDS